MKKLLSAAVVAVACLFAACKKTITEVTPDLSRTDAAPPQQFQLKCLIKEDAAKSAIARRNVTPSNEPIVLFLDFNGHQVSNTAWNTAYTSGYSFYAPGIPEGLLPEAARSNIVKWVTEDFSAFGVKVTRSEREYQDAPPSRRMRCIITQGMSAIFGNFGGLAYISSLTWSDGTPCFVFADIDLYVDKYIAEAVSHELGHTFGLYHQATFFSLCEVQFPYNPGLGSGNLSWAPIMGVSYYSHLSTWHEGSAEINGCSVNQNDVQIIKDIAGLKQDDHTDGLVHLADKLLYRGMKKGILETTGDKDVFYKDYNQSKRIILTSNGNSDLALEVYSQRGNLEAAYDDLNGTNVDAVVSGRRYLKVKISKSQPYVPAGDGFGGYTLRVTEPRL
jgi:Metallo-peptidase family M12B Reprolysin-like